MTEQHATDDFDYDTSDLEPRFPDRFGERGQPSAFDAAPVEPTVADEIRAAEAAQQRSICRIPDGELPDDLAKALERRVEVNLAQYDGGEIRRVGGTDPEVRRLEAPWSKTAPQE